MSLKHLLSCCHLTVPWAWKHLPVSVLGFFLPVTRTLCLHFSTRALLPCLSVQPPAAPAASPLPSCSPPVPPTHLALLTSGCGHTSLPFLCTPGLRHRDLPLHHPAGQGHTCLLLPFALSVAATAPALAGPREGCCVPPSLGNSSVPGCRLNSGSAQSSTPGQCYPGVDSDRAGTAPPEQLPEATRGRRVRHGATGTEPSALWPRIPPTMALWFTSLHVNANPARGAW